MSDPIPTGKLEELLSVMSKQEGLFAAGFLLDHPENIPGALDIAFRDLPRVSMRAAWVTGMAAEEDFSAFEPYLGDIIENLVKLREEGVRRCLLKMLHGHTDKLSEPDLGTLMGLCFRWLEEPSSAVAIKMYSMELLYEISKRFPEIKPELLSIIQFQMPEGSAGIKAGGRRITRRLNRELLDDLGWG